MSRFAIGFAIHCFVIAGWLCIQTWPQDSKEIDIMDRNIMATVRSSPWLNRTGLTLSVLMLGAGAIALPACNEQEEISEGRENVTAEALPQTSLVSESIGEVVTVRSTVQETLDANGIVLQSEGMEEDILVLNLSSSDIPQFASDVPVQVTGEVVEFTLADVESTYGLDLNEDLYIDYEEQPAILADFWAVAPTPEILSERPEAFYNQRIALEGDARILSPDAMALYEEGWIDDVGILVVGVESSLRSDTTNVQEGESVVVVGTTQPFDLETLRGQYDLGLTDEQLREFASRYTDRPIIMADDTYPTAVDD